MSPPSFFVLCSIPVLISILDLVDRKVSSSRAGWLSGFPIVGGPALLMLTLEHGVIFGAKAADNALLGVVGWSAFILCYKWRIGVGLDVVGRWLVICSSFLVWFVLSSAATEIGNSALFMTLLLVYAISLGLAVGSTTRAVARHGASVLVARVVLAVSFVLADLAISYIGGPRWSGAFTSFPIVSSSLLIPSFVRGGSLRTTSMVSGMLMAGPALATFMLVVSAGLRNSVPTWISFAVASAVALAVHIVMWRLVTALSDRRARFVDQGSLS